MTIPLPKTVLWDLDGTMIDQTVPIIRCYAEVITAMGYPEPSAEVIRRSMGGPMASTMRLFVEADRMDEACSAFRQRFPALMFDGLVVLPGALELTAYFASHNIPQAIFTNKHGETARLVSERCGFAKAVSVCIGNSDTEWAKPRAELTNFVLSAIDSSTDGAVLIGDSPTDVETAINAGIACYAVSTGAHSIAELNEAGATAAYSGLPELRANFIT
ncbi:MAG: HAD family hydrolase [Opitutales bacterium]